MAIPLPQPPEYRTVGLVWPQARLKLTFLAFVLFAIAIGSFGLLLLSSGVLGLGELALGF